MLFSVIRSQQRVIEHQQRLSHAYQKLAEEQGEICIQLVNEIKRIRSVANQLSTKELQEILVLLSASSRTEADNEILISTSQLLQTVTDDTIIDQVLALEDPQKQQAIYWELLVSNFVDIPFYRCFYASVFVCNCFLQASLRDVLAVIEEEDGIMSNKITEAASSIKETMKTVLQSKNSTLEAIIQNPEEAMPTIAPVIFANETMDDGWIDEFEKEVALLAEETDYQAIVTYETNQSVPVINIERPKFSINTEVSSAVDQILNSSMPAALPMIQEHIFPAASQGVMIPSNGFLCAGGFLIILLALVGIVFRRYR